MTEPTSSNFGTAGKISHEKILIVDDDPGIRETLSSLLEEQGYETLVLRTACRLMLF
jgi:DNA-binding NtrC family response regulator